MATRASAQAAVMGIFVSWAAAQSVAPPEKPTPQPLYKVTIVSRTTKAINYGYLSAATRIGFQGTPVAASATGRGTIEPSRGATLLNLSFDNLPGPGRFGPQYLTYVVWAISPDGRAQNLGELILDGSDEGKLSTSTPLQTFALIVTAEPYYSVSQPSDVVVLENVITRDTIGKVQEVNATYELLPRQPYTYDTAAQQAVPAGQPVSSKQYESLTARYQALNAIQIAQSQNADRYAPDQIARARQLYNKARGFPVHLSKEIVSMAREATQIAEDSRAIAIKRAAAEKAAQSATEGERARKPEPQPEPPRPEPQARVVPAQENSNVALIAPEQTRQGLAPPAQSTTEPSAPVVVDRAQFLSDHPNARENRQRLLAALRQHFEVLDSSRGVTITMPADASVRSHFSAIAAAVKPLQALHLNVEAHTDVPNSTGDTERHAMRVRDALIGAGISPDVIIARGYGNSRPRSSNASSNGRAQNRRIEIIIAGDAIGTLATWDRSYPLQRLQTRR